VYLDSSAIARRLLAEPGWEAFDDFIRASRVRVASELAVTEIRRAILRAGGSSDLRALADRAFDLIDLVPMTRAILQRAGELSPAALRTLDAIHLATAMEVGPVDAFVTYDNRLAEAARRHGLEVAAPS